MRASPDARLILAAQGARAFAYGLGAVLLGTTLDRLRLSAPAVGIVLGAVLTGTVMMSIAVGRFGDRVGRRRFYLLLYVALAGTGAVYAEARQAWVLALVALVGALSTEVVESGPFTSLEQAMLATGLTGRTRVRGFGVYNAVAAAAGSLGALAAGLPSVVRHVLGHGPADQRWFWLFVPAALIGAVLASRLSPAVEAGGLADVDDPAAAAERLGRSRPTVTKLAVLFATDSFAGGFTVQSFIAFWLTRRFGATAGTVGLVFFAVGLLQTLSFLAAPRLAERFGLLATMVFTHLPSNVLLAALAFAPSLPAAVALLFGRVMLSQMDVPTRQAYVMALVEPGERTAAAAYTNTARYLTRPAGPALAGVVAASWLGAPFLIAGSIKSVYDMVLWSWFRRVDLKD
jgi:MFS family permease